MDVIASMAGVILERAALATGFVAAAIAVGAFVARSQALLGTTTEAKIQRYTAIGGLFGLSLSLSIILLDTGIG